MKWSNTIYHLEISRIKGIVGGFNHNISNKYNSKRWALMELEQMQKMPLEFSNLKTRLINSAIQKAINYVKSVDASDCQVSCLYHSSFIHRPEYYSGI